MTALVDRAAGFLESRLSRRSFINRSAYAGSAVAIGAGLDLALRPGTAYGAICTCGGTNCNCGSTCCAGFTEFCCSINDGYNYCPTGSLLGGWWKADNSSYCGEGPRYYMDCHAQCSCTTGCGGGWGFCEPLQLHEAFKILFPDGNVLGDGLCGRPLGAAEEMVPAHRVCGDDLQPQKAFRLVVVKHGQDALPG